MLVADVLLHGSRFRRIRFVGSVDARSHPAPESRHDLNSRFRIIMPRVAILTGSKSDLPVLEPCIATLKDLGIEHELHVMSAHRSPAKVQQFASSAAASGFEVIIAAAGMAAHLPG